MDMIRMAGENYAFTAENAYIRRLA